jgi:murein DD-endopeptidase MepM/ murein hydrolase activator NlpD
MYQPIRKLKLAYFPKGDVTQWFGENPKLYAKFDIKGHNGIDIVRPHGELMYAIEDGEVVQVKDTPEGYGRHIRIVGDTKDSNNLYREWTYGHCSKILVKQGDKVTAGQAVACMGNTGFVVSGATPNWQNNPYAGTHLHLGLRYFKKPRTGGWSYEGSKVRLSSIGYDNGYKGSVDPLYELFDCQELPETDVWRQLVLTTVSLLNSVLNLLKK